MTRDTVRVQPETLYARSGDISIAYQVTGDGPFDVVFIPPFVTHVEFVWTTSFAPALEALSSFCRLIRFDKRGTGMSDRVGGAPTLETRMDDARAVMDAAGSRRAAFFGSSEGGAMSLLFAATYPERTAALVLRSAYPRTMWASDYPWGRSEEEYRREMERDLRLFGPRDQALEAVRSRRAAGGGRARSRTRHRSLTDIVGSSERAASLGDRAWRELLERHHELVPRQLVRFPRQ